MRAFWNIALIVMALVIFSIVTARFFVKYVAITEPVNQAVIEWKSE